MRYQGLLVASQVLSRSFLVLSQLAHDRVGTVLTGTCQKLVYVEAEEIIHSFYSTSDSRHYFISTFGAQLAVRAFQSFFEIFRDIIALGNDFQLQRFLKPFHKSCFTVVPSCDIRKYIDSGFKLFEERSQQLSFALKTFIVRIEKNKYFRELTRASGKELDQCFPVGFPALFRL